MKTQVPVLRTMTFNQLMEELRERGMSIGQEKLKAAIRAGIMPFAHYIPMGRDEYIIWRKGFNEWAAQHSIMETPISGKVLEEL